MKRVLGVLLVVLGVSLVLLGLVFIMGAAGKLHRYVVAVVCLGLGGASAGLGVRLFRQADAASPEQLRAEILALARREDGEVAAAEIAAALGRRAAAADAVMQDLVEQGVCERRSSRGGDDYVFAALQPRLMVRRCQFCEAELPLQGELTRCPGCGGTIATRRETRSVAGAADVYRMDE